MTRRPLIGLVAAALAVAALVGAWTILGPTQAGGDTSYAVVVGTSMEPKLHRGDLALVRRSTTYRPGDVVLYDSRELGAKVLHRIVRVEGDRFVLQGDNNDFLDPERPTADQIVGRLWVTVPAVGRATTWLREPWHAAVLVGLVTLLALGGGAGAGAAVRRGGRPSAARRRTDDETRVLVGAGVAVLALVALAVAAYTRPPTAERRVDGAYTHQGRFAYDARVPRSPVYPDGHVATGEPVFLRLVPRLRVAFDYALESELATRARGTVALDARISDGRGWERLLPLAAEERFAGTTTTVTGVLDLRRIERMVEQVRELTGSAQSTFTVSVLPRVGLAGKVGADRLDASFAPALAFELGDLRLQPSFEGDGVGPFAPRETGTGTATVPATISLGRISLDVTTARRVALVGLALLLLAGGLALAVRRRGGDGADDEGPYAHLIVPVAGRAPDERDVTELDDLASLARVAEHHGRLILRVGDDDARVYLVEDAGVTFRYRPRLPEPAELRTERVEGAPVPGTLIPGGGGARYREHAPR
jgi:signal peptidase I